MFAYLTLIWKKRFLDLADFQIWSDLTQTHTLSLNNKRLLKKYDCKPAAFVILWHNET